MTMVRLNDPLQLRWFGGPKMTGWLCSICLRKLTLIKRRQDLYESVRGLLEDAPTSSRKTGHASTLYTSPPGSRRLTSVLLSSPQSRASLKGAMFAHLATRSVDAH